MNLLWPGFLVLLGLLPLLVLGYLWMLRRRRRYAVRFSSLSLVREALPRHSSWRRHLPFALFLFALASLIFALTRPVSIINVPLNQASIILAMDVSISMRATDIPPSRMQAAQSAALSFIEHQKPGTQMGIVAFARFSELIQPPTSDKNELSRKVEGLTLGRGTAIGSGILEAIDAIAEINDTVEPSNRYGEPGLPVTSLPDGSYVPDIIVLLTDGVSNSGPFPLEAAQQAVDRGIRIYTIGFGTEEGSITMPFSGGQAQNNDPFGNDPNDPFGGGFRGRFRAGIDEATLKEIAEMTGGKYYYATSADELQSVFESLPNYLITREETTEISVIFAAVGALLAAAAMVFSLLWHPLP